MKLNKSCYNYIKWLWAFAVIFFIINYFYKNYNKLLVIISILPLISILLSFFFLLLGKIILSCNMYLSLRLVNINLSFLKCFKIYNLTQLPKYIPGSIWQFVGRVGVYANEGINKKKIRDSIFIETFWILSGAFVVGISLLSFTDLKPISLIYKDYHNYIHNLLTFLILFILIVGSYILFFRFNLIADFVNKIKFHYLLNIKLFFTQFFIWLFLGLSFFFTVEPYINEKLLIFFVIGLYAIAYVTGFLIPFAPAGLGIREAVLVMGLSIYLPSEISIILASINRILYIVTEVAIVLIIINIEKLHKHMIYIKN